MIHSYYRLLLSHPRLLSFSLLFAFFSAPGQTFFLSFFIPPIIQELGLSASRMSGIYSAATLGAAVLLPWAGRLSDASSQARVVLWSSLLLGSALLLFSLSVNQSMLFISLLALRFSGQGLFTHISQTSAARQEVSIRGKSLGFASLGHPLSEGAFPIALALAIGVFGWRPTLATMGGIVILAVLPLALSLSRGDLRKHSVPFDERSTKSETEVERENSGFWKEAAFLLNMPAAMIFPALVTGLILFQASWAESMEWSPAWMATCFLAFAICRTAASLLSGPWVDRYGAARIFALHLLPFALGTAIAGIFGGMWVPLAFFSGAGFTAGLSGCVKTSLWVDLFGIRRLGSVRSLSSSLQILGTAIGPLLMGIIHDRTGNPKLLFAVSLGLLFVAWTISLVALKPRLRLVKPDLAVETGIGSN